MISFPFPLPDRARILSLTRTALIASLFVAFFSYYLSIKLWDYDFWWHIATGKYIMETRSLPDKDPFSFTSEIPENRNKFPERENFILKQYWLSQIFFYKVYDYSGPAGIIFLRTSLLILTLLVVFRRLKKWSVSLPVSFIFLFALFEVMEKSSGERPVLFTILFTSLVFSIIEGFRERKDKRIFMLLPLMLLWANLHGGFVLGAVIILTYMFCEGVMVLMKRSAFTRQEILIFYVASISALCLSFLNPTGAEAVALTFSTKYKPFYVGIQEYNSPLSYYLKNKVFAVNYSYVFLAALFPLILILRNKKFDFTHGFLMFGLFAAGLSAMRFMVFYAIVAAMVLGRESDRIIKDLLHRRLSEESSEKVLDGLTVAALFSVVLFIYGNYNRTHDKFSVDRNTTPEAAVDFVEKNRLNGNIFNDYGYGGYLTWRLYPWKKNFIDSRSLNLSVMTEFSNITRAEIEPIIGGHPFWEVLLRSNKINIVFLSLFDVYDQVPPLVFNLSESSAWAPVYCDKTSVIFVKNNEQNSSLIEKFRISKEVVYNAIINRGIKLALFNPVNKNSFMSVGETFYRMGRLKDALAAYKYASQRLPSPDVQERINSIESEIKARGGQQ